MTTGNGNIRVALPWHSLGHGNLGVDALTRANISILRAAADRVGRQISFETLCSTGRPSSLPEDVAIGPMPRIKPLLWGRSDFLQSIRRADLVVDIGEGDSWADIYGPKRFALQAGTKLAAIALRKPLILAPQTIGPFNNKRIAQVADWTMNRARAVFSRDGMSTTYLRTHRIKSETAEYIDVAFRLPFSQRPKSADGKIRIGLNVSGLLFNGGYSGNNELGLTINYADFTKRLIGEILSRPNTEIHLISHVTADGGRDDDRSVIPALTVAFPAIVVPETFADASDAKSYMSGLDFVIGGRMHACIGAFSARVPVVPIAYSRKFNGLFGTLGYSHIVDGKSLNTEAAFRTTMDFFDRRTDLLIDIDKGLIFAMKQLQAYEDKLASIMAALK